MSDRVPSHRRARSIVRLVAAVTAVSLSVAACTGDDSGSTSAPTVAESDQGGVLRLGVVDLTSLDPALISPSRASEMIAVDLLYDALAVYPGGVDNGGEGDQAAVPDLAESFTANSDFSIWTVPLSEATFSDGSPVTASDVKFTLERLAARGAGSVQGTRLEIIGGYGAEDGSLSGVRVLDDRTLEIALNEPYVQLPELLASPVYGIVPQAAVEAAAEEFAEAPVGSGPYGFEGRDGATVSLVRAGNQAGREVGPDGVELVSFDDEPSSYAAFGEEQLDWSLVPAELLDEAGDAHGDEYFLPFGGEVWLGVNQGNPVLANQTFRQAISKAVNREKVAMSVFPTRLPLDAVVVQGVPGAVADACGSACNYDPQGAQALLAEAFPDGDVPTVVIDTYDDPNQEALVTAVEVELEAAGIPVEPRSHTFAEYLTFVTSGEAAMFSFGWVGITPMQDSYLGPPFLGGSLDNVTGLGSAPIDLQIREARGTKDTGAREGLYQDVERQLLAAGVLLPIAQLRTNQVVGERVKGFEGRLDGTFVVGALSLEK